MPDSAQQKEPIAGDAGEAELAPAPRLQVSASPHLRAADSIPRLMWTVSIALLPAGACGVAVFGPRVLWVLFLAIATALATEAACQLLRRRPVTVGDGSAFLTGLLVAFCLPVHMPWYVRSQPPSSPSPSSSRRSAVWAATCGTPR